MRDVLGLIFAYHAPAGMRDLVQRRTAASVPFGGRYRAIDFPLSCLANAGVGDVGVILRDSYQSLTDHLGAGKDWDLSRKNGGLILLPPFSYGGTASRPNQVFSGKMEALQGVEDYIRGSSHRYVVLCEGDCVANIRFSELFRQHLASGADVTALCVRQPVGDPACSVYYSIENGRITGITAHPAQPQENESLGVFVMKRELLLRMIEISRTEDVGRFEHGVLRRLLPQLGVRPMFHEGYVARMHTLRAYYRHSCDLLLPEVRKSLFDPENPIRTRVRDDPPVFYAENSRVTDSLAANGCRIEGTVENSVLFRGVYVAPGAVVRNCIVMQNTVIGENACLSACVLDKNCTVGAGIALNGTAAYPVVVSKGTKI